MEEDISQATECWWPLKAQRPSRKEYSSVNTSILAQLDPCGTSNLQLFKIKNMYYF